MDGFQACYWRRPERYLEPEVQASISTMALLPEDVLERAMSRLSRELENGEWERKYGYLREHDEMDFAYRLFVSRAS